jgi:micrococcal nuclease
MTKPWKPEIVTPDWARSNSYRGGGNAGKIAVVLVAAVAAGLGAGWLMQPTAHRAAGKPDAPIEWHAVQAVPRRSLSADEIEWEKRGQDQPVIASPEGARQSSGPDVANEEAGLPRGSAARNDSLIGATGKLYVIDGDTFGIGEHRIRIANIDAPETHPPRCLDEARLGLAATQRLNELLASGTVTMSGAGHDRYGRELRYVQVDGQDVGEAMIAAGLARSYAGGKRQGWC